MWDHFLIWLDSSAAAQWVQGVGTVGAAMVALVAGILAYRGARKQAAMQIEHSRKSLAASIYVELNHCRTQFTFDAINLRRAPSAAPIFLPIKPIPTPVFNAVAGQIGQLPADLAFRVVQQYAVIEGINRRYSDYLESSRLSIERDHMVELADEVEEAATLGNFVVELLAAESDVKKEMVITTEALADAYRAKRGPFA